MLEGVGGIFGHGRVQYIIKKGLIRFLLNFTLGHCRALKTCVPTCEYPHANGHALTPGHGKACAMGIGSIKRFPGALRVLKPTIRSHEDAPK